MSKAYIDRINVYGFKSYGLRKLSIPVGDGFVGIVGPNGSGKSNIGDSIVFALGLATAKSMRALKLSDLIFSSKGKSAPYAEVEIIFKNEGAFPLNDEEVSIYRKVEHNGKSTYKINGRVAKQYEVEELLTAAGIPKQGYNIVTQGDIFRFIKMTPAERRDLISEIAGITEYEERKEKALKDLEEANEKLSTAKMVLKEVKTNLEKLEKERENALKAKDIEEKIENLKEQIKGVRLYLLEKEKNEVLQTLKDIEEKINNLYAQKENSIEKQKEIIKDIKQLEDTLNEIQESLLPIKEKEGSITAQIRLYNDKINDLNKEIENLKETLIQITKEKEEKIKEVLNVEKQIEQLNKKLPDLELELEEAENELKEKNEKLKQIEVGGSKAKLDLGQIEKEEKQLKDKLNHLEKEEIKLKNDLERIYEKIENYKKEIEELNSELERLRNTKENISSYAKTQERKLKSLEGEINRLKIRKDALSKKLINIRNKREENFKKLTEVLVKLQHTKEDKTYEAIKDINGVYGKVADLISVKDEKLITAIESAGGGRLNNIVVENDQVAKECIEILRKNKLGKATFIPLNTVRTFPIHKPPLRKGVIGLAIDFVDYDPKIEKAIKYVFSDTVIVETFDDARTVGIGTFRMVSLDGDIFEKTGTISGGSSTSGFSIGKGALENEKERLEKEDDRLKLEEEVIEKELKKIEEELKSKENEIFKIKAESESIIQRKQDIETEYQNKSNRIKFLEEQIINLKKSQFEIESQLDNLSKDIEKTKNLLTSVEEKKKEILSKMENQGLHTLRKEWEEITNKVYKLREEKNKLLNQLEILEDKLENNLKVRIFQIENEKQETENKIKEKEDLVKQLKEKIEEESKQLTKLWQGLKDKEKERDELLQKIDHLKEQLKVLRYEEDEANKQITFLLEDKGKLEQKIEDIDLELQELLLQYSGEPIEGNLKELEKQLSELEKIRKDIGAVNQKALEDYKEVHQRYLELKEKVETLLSEKKSIEELIESLEEKKLQAFMEVYEAVNKNLNKMFKRLSPGGRAYLEIENEDDPLSGGIFLKAKPRGKDVKRLEIMSGGEKTLTALAFLFAVQSYRPAPFYYFDEVDAHLDDANARKIAELMKELSQNAQFIVVTLRDTMASYADRLLGVSAREGISNVYTLDMAQITGND